MGGCKIAKAQVALTPWGVVDADDDMPGDKLNYQTSSPLIARNSVRFRYKARAFSEKGLILFKHIPDLIWFKNIPGISWPGSTPFRIASM
jgi:hypothetical protein